MGARGRARTPRDAANARHLREPDPRSALVSRPQRGNLLVAVGLVLLLAAGCLAAYNVWDARRAAAASADALAQMRASSAPVDALSASGMDPGRDLPVVTVDGRAYVGVLSIPTLGLELPVQATWSYDNLKASPCRYAGTPYAGGFVVAAHNYAAHFGRVGQLATGDEVSFTDVDGNVFRYRVEALEVLGPDAVAEMTDDEWDLTLFTCTLGGASRVTARCTEL